MREIILNSRRGTVAKKYRTIEKTEPFKLPTKPGVLEWFYFSCGPLAALGFFVGGVLGFLYILLGIACLYLLVSIFKR